jgi:hypothetical protein
MALARIVRGCAGLLTLALFAAAAASAQSPSAPDARVKVIFQAFDLNESGWLSGREVKACDCLAYDTDGNGEVTWAEFKAGYARAPLFGATPPRASAQQGVARRAEPAAPVADARASYRVGQEVEVNVDGTWYQATVVGARDGRFALSRHDRSQGVTTSDEWITADRLRPWVAPPHVATASRTPAPTALPLGDYVCTTYQTNAMVGVLRLYGGGLSSGVTRDGSGPQRRYAYDPAAGTLRWDGGLTIAGWTVEAAEYRPQSDGRPNINLHYRLRAGGNLNSMSCLRS